MKMQLHALSVRFGQIDDGPYWCKVNTLESEIINKQGFAGQQVVEYSVDGEKAKEIASQLKNVVPAAVDFQMSVTVQSGKPVLKILSATVPVAKAS